MRRYLALLLTYLLLWPLAIQAQDDRKPPVLYPLEAELTSESPQEAIDAFKKQIKAKEIEFSEHPNGYNFIRANVRGSWLFLAEYSVLYGMSNDFKFLGYYPLSLKDYDVEMPDSIMWTYLDRFIVSNKDKQYLARENQQSYELEIDESFWFEDLEVEMIEVELFLGENPITGEPTTDNIYKISHLNIKQDGQWGIALWENEQIKPITNFNFEQKADLPDSLFEYFRDYSSYPDVTFDTSAISKAQSVLNEAPQLDFVLYRWSPSETKDVFIAYQQNNMLLISHEVGAGISYAVSADEIKELGADAFWVRQDNKVGFYSPDLTAHTEIIYDDVEQLFLDSRYGCVTVLNEAYELYDCKTAQKLIPGKASSLEELKDMWLNRN
jgi:hypothetical protein